MGVLIITGNISASATTIGKPAVLGITFGGLDVTLISSRRIGLIIDILIPLWVFNGWLPRNCSWSALLRQRNRWTGLWCLDANFGLRSGLNGWPGSGRCGWGISGLHCGNHGRYHRLLEPERRSLR